MDEKTEKKTWAARFARGFRAAVRFVNRDVWELELSALRGARRSLVRSVRVLYLVARGFRRDECTLHASSLTFMTLLAVVPVLALALSLARAAVDTSELRESAKGAIRKFFDAPAPVERVVAEPSADDGAASSEAEEPGDAAEPEAADGPLAPRGVGPADTAAERVPDGATPPQEASEAGAPPPEETSELNVEKLEGLVDKGFEIVEHLNFRALGGVGLLLLVWTVIGLLGNIEKSFNHVWGVAKPRTLARKFTDYLSVVIILPFLCAAASSVPVVSAVTARLHRVEGYVGMGGVAAAPFFRSLWVIGVLTLAFCFLLRFAPNTRVRFRPGLLGGFVAAVGLSVWLKLCLGLQIGVAKNSALFGSFAMVPILLSWVYVSWTILLVAAEVSYAAQNADSYELETGWETPSARARLILSTALLRSLAASVQSGPGTLSIADFTKSHRVSFRLVRTVCRQLCDAGIIAPVEGEPDTFASRIDLSRATVGSVAKTMLDAGSSADSLGLESLPHAALLSGRIDAILADTPALSTLPESAPPPPAKG